MSSAIGNRQLTIGNRDFCSLKAPVGAAAVACKRGQASFLYALPSERTRALLIPTFLTYDICVVVPKSCAIGRLSHRVHLTVRLTLYDSSRNFLWSAGRMGDCPFLCPRCIH